MAVNISLNGVQAALITSITVPIHTAIEIFTLFNRKVFVPEE